MKLKEKLAKDYTQGTDTNSSYTSEAYLAGFERCRDLFIAEFGHVEGGAHFDKMISLGNQEVLDE